MSILGSIMSKVFGRRVDPDEARAQGRAEAQAQRPAQPAAPRPAQPAGTGAAASQTGAGGGHPSAAGAQPTAAAQPVDVEAMLTALDATKPGKSNWRTSIVDLMDLLGIDSSRGNREELARELGYTGDTSDSAAMNVWLHRQVMNALARNGGVVPASMRD